MPKYLASTRKKYSINNRMRQVEGKEAMAAAVYGPTPLKQEYLRMPWNIPFRSVAIYRAVAMRFRQRL